MISSLTSALSSNDYLLDIEGIGGPHFGPISFRLRARECIFINGPSGSGKSLFLRALADLDPNEGDVSLNARTRRDFDPQLWRQQVGLLPAESQWWAEVVGDHFPEHNDLKLQSLGFENDVLQWSVSRLSSGERQRLAILRLLANRPYVLLLDEPTANLDRHNTVCVEALIKQYIEDLPAGVLWVSHDTSQIERNADRVIVFKNGRIAPS